MPGQATGVPAQAGIEGTTERLRSSSGVHRQELAVRSWAGAWVGRDLLEQE